MTADPIQPKLSKEMKDRSAHPWMVPGVLAFVVLSWGACFGIWAYYIWGHHSWTLKPQDAGLFGDTFGAVNALFSGLALTGVAYAVMLQHRELDATRQQLEIARGEAADSKKAQIESDRLQARQAAALFATAKLNALGAILGATQDREHTVIYVCGMPRHVFYRDINLQSMRILLRDLDFLAIGKPEHPFSSVSMFRRFLVGIVREFHARLCEENAVAVITSLRSELLTLLAHQAVAGTDDFACFEGIYRLIATRKLLKEAKTETDSAGYRKMVSQFLSDAESACAEAPS